MNSTNSHHSKYWQDLVLFEGVFADFSEIEDIYNTMMVIFCVICAGIAAGLTVGLLSLDETKLEIKVMIGTEEEKIAAVAILPIIRQHHLLLVTLLLFNSLANETLPIFLGTLVPNYLAVIISVTLVLIFGEIIPTALFTGANQLTVASKLTNVVYFLFILFYPIAFPIAKILDYFLGEDEAESFTREELEALVLMQSDEYKKLSREDSILGGSSENLAVKFHNASALGAAAAAVATSTKPNPLTTCRSSSNNNNHNNHPSSNQRQQLQQMNSILSNYEVSLMTGIMKLSKLTVKDAFVPIHKVFMKSSSTRLNVTSLYDILDSGFSRILIYKRKDKQHLLGYLLVKDLIVVSVVIIMIIIIRYSN
jgi:metal transporter CNNM